MKNKSLKSRELALFCQEMALILGSGVAYQEGLAMIGEDLEDSFLKNRIKALEGAIENGMMYTAMAEVGGFPEYMISMIKVGETTGRLDEVMEALSVYYSRNDAVEKSLRTAVLFPVIMALMMFGVILVLMVKVLPLFYSVLQDYAGEMSGFSLSLLHFGVALSKNSTVVTIVLVVLLLLLFFFLFVPWGQTKGRKLVAKVFPKTAQSVALAGFSSAMAMMLKSGMDIGASLNMAQNVVGDAKFQGKIKAVQADLAAGKSFGDAMVRAEVFSHVHGSMLSLGVKTGEFDAVMEGIAAANQSEAEERISGMIAVIEPVIVGVFSLVIAMILLAVVLPLMGVMTAL